jgi:hypothetical protein
VPEPPAVPRATPHDGASCSDRRDPPAHVGRASHDRGTGGSMARGHHVTVETRLDGRTMTLEHRACSVSRGVRGIGRAADHSGAVPSIFGTPWCAPRTKNGRRQEDPAPPPASGASGARNQDWFLFPCAGRKESGLRAASFLSSCARRTTARGSRGGTTGSGVDRAPASPSPGSVVDMPTGTPADRPAPRPLPAWCSHAYTEGSREAGMASPPAIGAPGAPSRDCLPDSVPGEQGIGNQDSVGPAPSVGVGAGAPTPEDRPGLATRPGPVHATRACPRDPGLSTRPPRTWRRYDSASSNFTTRFAPSLAW